MNDFSILLKNLENYHKDIINLKNNEINNLKKINYNNSFELNYLHSEIFDLKQKISKFYFNEQKYENKINILKKRINFTEKLYNNLYSEFKSKNKNKELETCYICQHKDYKSLLIKPCKCNGHIHFKCYLKLLENKFNNKKEITKCDFCQQHNFKIY